MAVFSIPCDLAQDEIEQFCGRVSPNGVEAEPWITGPEKRTYHSSLVTDLPVTTGTGAGITSLPEEFVPRGRLGGRCSGANFYANRFRL